MSIKLRLFFALIIFSIFSTFVYSENLGSHVGGDIKFYLYDESRGEVNGASQSNDQSSGISSAIIYINKEISDNLTVDLQPEFLVHAGATPRLGGEITRADEGEIDTKFLRANITYRFENGIQAKAGVLKPLFCWDYGYELFWNETYHGSFVTANPWLGSWHDAGLEIYKTLELDAASIPLYGYILNGPGGDYVDNNDGASILLHTAPEFHFDWAQIKLLASYGSGKWDNANKHNFTKYAFGIDLDFHKFRIRSEYMGGDWENKFIILEKTTKDISPKGYYVKLFFDFIPKVTALISYDKLEHDFSGFYAPLTSEGEEYNTVTLGINYFLEDVMTIMLDYVMLDGERSLDTAELENKRLTLGARVTF